MTATEARSAVQAGIRSGLIQPPAPTPPQPKPRPQAQSAWQRQRAVAIAAKHQRSAWHQLTREEQREYRAMCMRRLRAERRGLEWDGPQRARRTMTDVSDTNADND